MRSLIMNASFNELLLGIKGGVGGGKTTLLREADEQKKTTLSPALTSLAAMESSR